MPISAKLWIVIGRSALGLAVCVSLAHAEITLDGSLGPSGPVPGAPNYAISSNLGRQAGSNLFHSFGLFNINTGESATFSGPSTVENILSRVTGGTASTIDGLLRTDFPGASPNLFLMNPSGVMFGPNAELDVQGSFHATTADYIKLADGVRFTPYRRPRTRCSRPHRRKPLAFSIARPRRSPSIEANSSVRRRRSCL